jgi:hypothetical protein
MQQEKSIIRSLVDPAIPLDTMSIGDLDTGTSEQSTEAGLAGYDKSIQQSKDLGTNYPFVSINNYIFANTEIETFEINCNSFIPTVRMKAGVKSKTFTSQAIPKDGDIMSVFIRARNNAFKPIRNDYRITSVRSTDGNQEGRNAVFTISGELFVPHLYDEIIKSYKGTSYEVLKEIAKELQLGFASNDTETDDSQVWINPGGDYYNLINDIADHAWKDEKSFFNVFIDLYYNLNFVNVNNQFNESTDLDMQLLTNLKFNDSINAELMGKTLEKATGEVPKMLSNWEDLKGTSAYIHYFNMKNASNVVNQEHGYKTYTMFFEQNSEQYWSLFTDPLTTDGAEADKIILKGRATKPGAPKEEYWKTQNRYRWEGIQYSAPEGNCHQKYNFAKNWNLRNNAELQKMYVEAQLENGNFNIYRGERLPLIIFVGGDLRYQTVATPPEAGNVSAAYPPMLPDKFYSGYYMVSGMRINYSPQSKTVSSDINAGESPGFTQTMVLTRREWPTPI